MSTPEAQTNNEGIETEKVIMFHHIFVFVYFACSFKILFSTQPTAAYDILFFYL